MIDHLVLVTNDLEQATQSIGRCWGVTPSPGGAHVGHGTRNELVGIGGGSYLEIIGPDRDQADYAGSRPFGAGVDTSTRLATWSARANDALGETCRAWAAAGHDVGQPTNMSRRRPDGVLLQWRLTHSPWPDPFDGVVPFLIDWQHTEHPSTSLHQNVELLALELSTPHLEQVRQLLACLGTDVRVQVSESATTSMVATLQTPAGVISL